MTPSDDPLWVDAVTLDRELVELADVMTDLDEGLFGPDSVFWEVNRHAVVYFAGAVQSVQMQLCHPWVATAVHEHSKIMENPRERARLTYIFLWSLIYGDRDMVLDKARSLYKVHGRVTGEIHDDAGSHVAGSSYGANEAHAMLWVHVTAFWCRVRLYEQLVRPLSTEEKDRFVREAQRYALCFGIPRDIQPDSWRETEDYVASMAASDSLARTDPGLEIRHFLESSIPRPLRGSIWNFIGTGLPERIAELLDQPLPTPDNLKRARRTARVLRVIERLLPPALRYVPAWHEAQRRIAGKIGPGWFTARLNMALLKRSALVSRS